jgi:hypothetical protein
MCSGGEGKEKVVTGSSQAGCKSRREEITFLPRNGLERCCVIVRHPSDERKLCISVGSLVVSKESSHAEVSCRFSKGDDELAWIEIPAPIN